MATRKSNKVVYVSNLFLSGIRLFLFQLMAISLVSVLLHDFLMKYQRISLHSNAHSHTVYFIMIVWNKACNYFTWKKTEEKALYFLLKKKDKNNCYCTAVVADVSKG